MSKSNIKLIVGLGIAAAATTAIVIGVVRELKAIRNLTIDVDELPEDPADLLDGEEAEAEEPVAEAAEAEVVEEAVAE